MLDGTKEDGRDYFGAELATSVTGKELAMSVTVSILPSLEDTLGKRALFSEARMIELAYGAVESDFLERCFIFLYSNFP